MRSIDADALKEQFTDGAYTVKGVREIIDNAPTVSDYLVEIARKNFELGRSIGKSESEIVKNITRERVQKGDTELISRRDIKDHIGELLLVYSGEELANAILNAIDNAPTVAQSCKELQEVAKEKKMDDLISRQDAIDALEDQLDYLRMLDKNENPTAEGKWYGVNWARNTIADLPPVQKKGEWIRKEDIIHLLECWADGYSYIEIPTDTAIKAIKEFKGGAK